MVEHKEIWYRIAYPAAGFPLTLIFNHLNSNWSNNRRMHLWKNIFLRNYFRNYDINYKMVLIQPDSQEYKRFEETYPEFSDTIPDFPRIILCNRQRHSRHKILDKYPNLTMHDLISLYQDIPTYKEGILSVAILSENFSLKKLKIEESYERAPRH